MRKIVTGPESEPSAPIQNAQHRTHLLHINPWIESALLIALLAIFVGRGFVPAWRSLNTDFPNYYLAARLYREHYPLADVYDWVWFQRQKDHAGIEKRIVSFIPLTLISAMPFVPLTGLPPLSAKRCWLVASLIFLILTILLLASMTRLGLRRTAILVFLAIEPLRTDFLFGQLHVFLLLVLALALWLYARGFKTSSGIGLALATGLKIYPAFFGLYFLRKKQWRALFGLIVGSIAVAAVSLYLFGLEANRVYVQEILPRIAQGENSDPYSTAWNSMSALLHRVFVPEPELNPHPLFNLPGAYAILQPLFEALLLVVFLWALSPRQAQPAREKLEWGAYVAMLLILSTNPASYQYCVLILTAVMTVDYLLRKERQPEAVALTVIYAAACFPLGRLVARFTAGWETLLAFPRLYLMLLFLLVLLVTLVGNSSQQWMTRLKSKVTFTFVLIFLGIATFGIFRAWRHQKGEFQNYASRLITARGSLLMGEPSAAGGKVLFSSLGRSDFITGALEKENVVYRDFGVDSFHPTSAPGSSLAWVELAGVRSRVVAFSPGNLIGDGRRFQIVAQDAEKPSVSPDGKWMVFIREVQGRGALYLKRIRPDEAGTNALNAEKELAGSNYQVLEATFGARSQKVTFSARPVSSAALFSVNLASHKITEITFGKPARYPAYSPDGQWLAYSKLEKGSWHLWKRRLSDGVERRLTAGECNSISPAWLPDSKTLIYATDCGRGVGLTALCRISLTR